MLRQHLRAPLTLCGIALALAGTASAANKGYYRYPDIHGETIVFCCEEDLWTVPAGGGMAERLTSDSGVETVPRFSPDGKWVAYSASYGSNYDVYVIPTEGGEPRRLTYHQYFDEVTNWTPDGKYVVYYTDMEHPFGVLSLYKVPVEGGAPEVIPVGEAAYTSFNKDGSRMVYNRRDRANNTWKRYLGGTQDDVYYADLNKKEFKQLTTFPGDDRFPMWVGERIVFQSERDGRRNIWSMDANGGDLKQLTFYTEFDTTWPETDGENRVVYQNGADLRVLDVATGKEAVVEITVPSERIQKRDKFANAADYLENYDLSPEGDRLLVTARGNVYNVPADKGRTIPLANTSGIREADASWAGKEGEKAVYWSDKSGEQQLYMIDSLKGGEETCITCDMDGHGAWHFYPAVSPDGNKVAWGDQTGSVFWSPLDKPKLTKIDDSNRWETTEYTWSPDSRYLAYVKYEANWRARLFIYDSKEDKTHAITDDFYSAHSPAWDPEGKYLFYVAERTFDPMVDAYDWVTALLPMSRPYMVLLNAESENPFREKDYYEEKDKKKDDEDSDKDKDEEKDEKKDKKDKKKDDKKDEDKDDKKKKDKEPVEVKIDWDGLESRHLVMKDVEPASIGGLVAAKDRIFYNVSGLEGMTGEFNQKDNEESGKLYVYEYKDDEPEAKLFASKVRSFTLSRDAEKLALLKEKNIYVVDSSAGEFKADGDDTWSVDLSEARIKISIVDEWRQILAEVHRMNRDFFYTPDMHGIDWKKESDKYAGLLDRVSTRRELNDVIGNLIGELGAGHTYLWSSGDVPVREMLPTGMLGADLVAEKDAILIKKIYRGTSWDPEKQSPLAEPPINVKDGEYILAVNGERVSGDKDPYSYFWNLAGIDITLTVNSKPTMTGARDIRVKPITSDGGLRYLDWVESNRKYVSEKTDGRVGYIHLPDMGSPGMTEFYRTWYSQLGKEGMIVDVRFNGGGNVSSIIIERLRRIVYAFGNVRNFDNETYPSQTFHGNMVCLTNERAGSDGDIFTRQFRIFNLGPIIGTRTWGGVVGIRGGKQFVDKGSISIPEFGYFESELGYDIENSGITPDIVLDNTAADQVAGRDAQMDKAIEVILENMKRDPKKLPPEPKPKGNSLEYFRQRSAEWMAKP